MIQKTLTLIAISVTLICCKKEQQKQTNNIVLLQEFTGPYGGVPAFDQLKIDDVKPAMLLGMELHLKDIDAIVNNSEPATFKNTIEAMERAGKELKNAQVYYGILSSNISTPEFRKIKSELAPIFSDFNSKITQNSKLFHRINTVYQESLKNPFPADQQRVIELIYKRFEMNGAKLNNSKKETYANINKELSNLYTQFASNVLHDEENYTTYLTKDELGGLSTGFIKSAAKIAEDKGEKGKYAVTNTRSSMDPFLTYSTNRVLRKKVWENYYSRGDNGDAYDNNDIVAQILKLRKQRVALLGHQNYAEWRLQNRMAKTPENALKLMEAVWPAAIARVSEEVKDMQSLALATGENITIEPWDYRFYAEKVRKLKYDLDSDEVKQYLQLDKLVEAMHFVAGKLFHFKFTPVPENSVPVFHKDVKVWEVTHTDTNENIGLWYFDPYAREGKRSGAWATTYRSHTTFDGKTNVLGSNNSNFIKPAPGEALLVSWDDAITCFHEFGHALHFFSSNVKYPTLSSGVRDYTEFQSQLLERWLSTDLVIQNYLLHYQTGKPMSPELISKIKKAATFNKGFGTTEYLASALIDMKLHLADPTNIDIDQFERETLLSLNMPKELPMRHRTPHFNHVFSGEGYATGYYGYLWADVLTSDAAEAFANAPNGFYDEEMAEKLVKYLFAPSNSMDPEQAYLLFRGQKATIEPLMRDRGFPIPKK
ncbi:M3 family metallopeptidase [Wenyingzhuangia sp. 1_MG-2023]|nr:M3 family metallopeptidase [Wenyingzhuangia sp. 1_MG-2023]